MNVFHLNEAQGDGTMNRMTGKTLKRVIGTVPALIVVGACGGESVKTVEVPGPTVTITATITVTETPTPASPSPTVDNSAGMFPAGYPKIVKVATIPFPVNSAFEGQDRAVQVAPGVWTSMPPGASVMDAATAGVLDGFCASIDAYERKFTPGEEHGGSCW